MMRNFLFVLFVLCTFGATAAPKGEIVIAKDGVSQRAIVTSPAADSITRLAASELAGYLGKISGATFSIATTANRGAIVVKQNFQMKPDAFEIGVQGKNIVIQGSGRGVLFGVYALLEKLGARLYAAGELDLPNRPTLIYDSKFAELWVPTIEYRDAHYRATNDQLYVDWHRLNHDASGALPSWGLFVHTFSRLCPPEKYWQSHPEYYSLRNGKRVPAQLCLSNPAVLEIVCENLAAEIAKNPTAKYWSVSSNDNFDYCQCDKCRALDDIDGSPTGSVIQFVNRVAERFPQKVISTLAYQYSRAAPKVTRVRDNVNIMFCNIECNRSLPIAEDPSSASFVRDMKQWSAITDNIFLWDYIIQFKNLVSPFPNLCTLEPNIRFFVDNNVKMLFEQGNRERGGEFSALRSYVVCKLMNYPDSSARSFISEFCDGYYGQGGEFVVEYIDTIEAALARSGDGLSIFGDPCTPSGSWLSPSQLAIYHSIFDKAESAVAQNAKLLRRVRIARQPLYYAQLEQAAADPHSENGIYNQQYVERLQMFIGRCVDEGVTRLSEWHTTPAEYLESMLRTATIHNEWLSFERPVTLSATSLKADAVELLTNGIQGAGNQNEWVPFSAPQYSITVDLGSVQPISSLGARFSELVDHWTYQPLPDVVKFYASTDNLNFTLIDSDSYVLNGKESRQMRLFQAQPVLKTNARYVKVQIQAPATVPQWHIRAGSPAVTMVDEIVVK